MFEDLEEWTIGGPLYCPFDDCGDGLIPNYAEDFPSSIMVPLGYEANLYSNASMTG